MTRVSLGDDGWFDLDSSTKYSESRDDHAQLSDYHQHQVLYKTQSGKFVLNTAVSPLEKSLSEDKETWKIIDKPKAYAWMIENGHSDNVPEEWLNEHQV